MSHRRAPQADSDLYDIWYYIAKESGSADIAERFVQMLTDHFYLLSRNPFIGRTRDDLRAGLRSFPVGNYVIIYRIENKEVLILRVLHGSRDIEGILRQTH